MSREGVIRFIGVVEKEAEGEGKIRIFPTFCPGLKGIEAFSHLIVLYWMHRRDDEEERRTLLVVPRRHRVREQRGVFACRSPSRPNPIGLCVTELVSVEDGVLGVRRLDALAGSPVIDLKPYLPRADAIPDARVPVWTTVGPST